MTEESSKRRVSRDEIVELASELIAIPSPTGTEVTIMQWVTDWCDRHGLPYEIFTKEPVATEYRHHRRQRRRSHRW